jgi:hypothetical protein
VLIGTDKCEFSCFVWENGMSYVTDVICSPRVYAGLAEVHRLYNMAAIDVVVIGGSFAGLHIAHSVLRDVPDVDWEQVLLGAEGLGFGDDTWGGNIPVEAG